MQSAYLYINSKKLPFSRGFNLISNLGKSKMAGKTATIVSDVTGLQQCRHP